MKKKIFYFLIIFWVNFCIMVFEILGSRILAPYIGTSLSVWTSIIGVILLFLSLGYYVGGFLARKNYLGPVLFSIALSFLYVLILKDFLLTELKESLYFSKNLFAVISSVVLFGPVSFFSALVSPIVAKKIIEFEEYIGEGLGKSYTISALGGITGTFITGFYLIPSFGIQKIILGLSISFILLSLFFIGKSKYRIVGIILYLCILIISLLKTNSVSADSIFSKETIYGDIKVTDSFEEGIAFRNLYIDNLVHSKMVLNSTVLAAPYAHYYKIPNFLKPELKRTLMIGGGAYSYPKYYLENYRESKIDVVEINPELTQIAKDFFDLKNLENLNIYHEDGRIFLEKSKDTYDAILMDAFNGFSIPYHLTTVEFLESIDNHLTDDGVVVVNIPGLLEGDGSEFIYTQYKTYKTVFPEVDLFPVRDPKNLKKFQNIMLVARKKKGNFPYVLNEEYNYLMKNIYKDKINTEHYHVLTDDFAPVEFLTKSFSNYF